MKRAVISILLGVLVSAAFCAPIPAERAAEALLTAFFTGDEAGVARNSSPQGLRKFSGHDREELIREAARFGVFRGILSSRELEEDRVEVRCRFSDHPVRFLVSCAPDGRVNGFAVLPDIDIPRLTRAQMLADFDYLTAMLEKICPLFTVNRKVYDVDITGTLAAYRSRITGGESPEAFYRLIQDALQACRGNHLWVTAALTELPPALHDFLSVYRGFVDPAALETTAAVTIREGGRRPAGPDLGLIYCEGAYYTKFDFTLHGVTYPRGMKLLSIDGISPELFLAEQSDHLDNFDAARKTFYDSGEIPFYTRSGRWGKMPLVFRFERPDGATVTFPLAATNSSGRGRCGSRGIFRGWSNTCRGRKSCISGFRRCGKRIFHSTGHKFSKRAEIGKSGPSCSTCATIPAAATRSGMKSSPCSSTANSTAGTAAATTCPD